MKRLLCLLLAFTLLMACACLPAGAEHTHKWKDVDTIQQPTCTEPGWKIQYCTGCGQTRDVRIPALGHDMTGIRVDMPSCTEAGKSYRYCQREGCDAVETEEIPEVVVEVNFFQKIINFFKDLFAKIRAIFQNIGK